MPFAVVDGPTIPAGQSLSNSANCSAGSILRITVPQEYTEASLTFQVSTDGKFFNDLYDAEGNVVEIVATPDSSIVLKEEWVRFIPFIKFRSGTRDAPVEQAKDCKFAIALHT
jgi:hypothetical protein